MYTGVGGNYVYSEQLYYADGSKPAYNGNISAKVWNGNRYDYSYDRRGRLTSAVCNGLSNYGFSTNYSYDVRGNISSMDRYGIVDRLPSGAEEFDRLDHINTSYTGNKLRILQNMRTAARMLGIGGVDADLAGCELKYDILGRLIYDESQDITSIEYDTDGHPVAIYFADGHILTNEYDGIGNRLSSTLQIEKAPALGIKVGDTGLKTLSHISYTAQGIIEKQRVFKADPIQPGKTSIPVVRYSDIISRFGEGYFDKSGHPCYYVRDYQGNNVAVVNAAGTVVQQTDYYPYGQPWREPEGDNTNLFSDKDHITDAGLDAYDFHARRYFPGLPRFTTPDPAAELRGWESPYTYCCGNPVLYIDPSGCIVEGVAKKDAAMAVEDFRAMFPGEAFANFRNLIVQSGNKQNGKSFAHISDEALSAAFSGITLNEDQQALVELVVNTINSADVHKVEYLESAGILSDSAETEFAQKFDHPYLPISTVLNANGGIPVDFVYNRGGAGLTTTIENGTYSLIFKDSSFHPFGRAVTAGHEIIGHGKSLAIGRGDSNQHVDAIQTENLILRVMGIHYINTGEDHIENGAFPGCSLLPNFR